MFVQWNGKQGAFRCCFISVESFIRDESAPGGQMWCHGATTNREWIQHCNQTFFILQISCPDCILPFRNPSNTIQYSVYNDCAAPVSHERLNKEFSCNFGGFVSCCCLFLKVTFFHSYFERKIVSTSISSSHGAILLSHNDCSGHTTLFLCFL